MALIQFTRNHTDHSTDQGYQFEFFCDRCGNGFRSEFVASVAGIASGALRAAGSMLGGIFGRATAGTYEIERAIQGPAHDNAFKAAIEAVKPSFRQCPKCSKWACVATCWNQGRALCFDCAPDIETEIAAAQAQTTVDQVKEKLRGQDLTKGLDLSSDAVALCPSCGARTAGAKFCPECGKPLRPKNECGMCGAAFQAGTKFCPECGNKLA